mmetsp:Transcript_7901/g.20566  ORF Transcript_7901/g.20566 Transcript_7901/m.20566 type:complete len:257 (-) Transcript_7901:921-1691(-)|eukprot:CAMPEP_0113879888 /NCGR_PEP_ID=MMETSP0780_2-20120614/7481_1 /TAXON_ID=652834 /ORGANISM="Palpitomonas bilix" /LENGTH=256 /DNA_ID=CAMNT_0000866505 /DNA_START=134 /DNA_END=904 /DNA_ORIENTATION=+ /assembly_acc=CAM_ASM_000599
MKLEAVIESIPVSPYIAKQKKETTSRRGKDLKPRRRRSYKQLQEETREYHFCPCDGCERKYVGSYGSFNLFVHVKNKHYNGVLDAGSLRKKRIDILPMPSEDGGAPTQTRNVTYVLLTPEELKAAGKCDVSDAIKTEPAAQASIACKPAPSKKPVAPLKKKNVLSAAEIEEVKNSEKLKIFQNPVLNPVEHMAPLSSFPDFAFETESQDDLEDDVSVLSWDPEAVSPAHLSSESEEITCDSPGTFDLNLDELFAFH